MARVFLSYRIADSAGHAGRLADALKPVFGRSSVFLAADDIAGGALWREELSAHLRSSSVVLALIGPSWATIAGPDGTARLANDDDVVRFEIREALALKRPLVPVLVAAATAPRATDLPPDVRALLNRNIISVRDEHWQQDVLALTRAVAALHVSLRARFLASRFATLRTTIWVLIGAMFVIAAGHLLLVRLDWLEARTLELLPPLLSVVLATGLLVHVFMRRTR